MQFSQSILWTPTSAVNNQNVSVQQCNAAVDSQFKFVTEGTDINGQGFQAAYAIVDNLVNAFTATIIFGPQQYGVAPYTRRTFPLPDPTPFVEIDLLGGIVTLTLCQSDMKIPDEQNQFASSGGGGGVAEYNPYFNRNGVTPVASEVLFAHYFERAVQFQNNFNGIVGGVALQGGVNPAATYVCAVYNGTTHIGDLSYHTDGTMVATTIGGASGNFSVGQCMTVIGNAVPDGAIENFSATFAMLAV